MPFDIKFAIGIHMSRGRIIRNRSPDQYVYGGRPVDGAAAVVDMTQGYAPSPCATGDGRGQGRWPVGGGGGSAVLWALRGA